MSVWKWCLLVFAFILIGLGVQGIYGAWRSYTFFNEQKDKIPLEMAVDLSKPGEYEGEFNQTWQQCCIILMNVYIEEGAFDEEISLDRLDLLKYSWEIVDANGEVVKSNNSDDDYIWHEGEKFERLFLGRLCSFENGVYTFKLSVINGIEEFSEIKQRLVFSYMPCGLEKLPAMVGGAVCLVFLVVGVYVLVKIKAGLNKTESSSV